MAKPKGDPTENKQAWDALYRKTEGSVWGSAPIPFVETFVAALAGEFTEDSRLLDAAAGDGRHVPVLLGVPGQIHVCDASPHALEKLARFNGKVEQRRCDLADTGFEDDFFDFISLIDTIETLPDPRECLTELCRIVKPGGKLLCNIPGKDDDISDVSMDPLHVNGDDSYLYQGTYYYRFFMEQEALDLVAGCGFELLRNEISHWREKAHPGFRDYAHEHTSRVLLLGKR